MDDSKPFRCPYCRVEIPMRQTISGVWMEGLDPDTGERHYCAKATSFDPSIQFQRQLVATLHLGYESNVNEMRFIDDAKKFMNRWEFFNYHALILWISKEPREPHHRPPGS